MSGTSGVPSFVPSLSKLLLVTLLISMVPVRVVNAAPLTFLSDQMSRLDEGAVSTHTIQFVTTAGVDAGETIVITVPNPDFTFTGTYDFNELQLLEGNSGNCDTASFSAETLAATPSGTTWGATQVSGVITFTSATGTIVAGRCVRVILGESGGDTVVNPTVTGNTNYDINISAGSPAEIGTLTVIVLEDTGAPPPGDQILITAEIVQTMSFDVDVATTDCNNATETTSLTNRIDYGVLAPAVAKYSNATIPFVCIDVAATAANGITVYVQSARAAAAGGLVRTGGGAIVSATANLNSGGTASGYGTRVSSVGTPAIGSFTATSPFNSATPGDVGLVPGTSTGAASLVSSSAPAATGPSSRIAVEVGAKAGVDTPGGYYLDILTFTATASF
jgi:hypothetical protein